MDDGRVAGPPDSLLALLVQKLLDLLVHTAFLRWMTGASQVLLIVHLLYWCKSTNTDAEGASEARLLL